MSSVSQASLIPLQLRYEQKAFWRNPAAAFFSFAFPLVLFVLFGAVFKDSRTAGAQGIVYYTPTILSYGVMSSCFVNIAITATFRREQGLLKRVRGTPLRGVVYVSGLILNAIIVSIIIVVLIVALSMIAYGGHMPDNVPALLLTLIVGAASMCALGLAVTSVIPNADAAPAMVNIIFFVLLISSGGFFPVDSSSALAHFAQVFPPRHFIESAFAAFRHGGGLSAVQWKDLAVIGGWGLAGLALTVRFFKWTPGRRG